MVAKRPEKVTRHRCPKDLDGSGRFYSGGGRNAQGCAANDVPKAVCSFALTRQPTVRRPPVTHDERERPGSAHKLSRTVALIDENIGGNLIARTESAHKGLALGAG